MDSDILGSFDNATAITSEPRLLMSLNATDLEWEQMQLQSINGEQGAQQDAFVTVTECCCCFISRPTHNESILDWLLGWCCWNWHYTDPNKRGRRSGSNSNSNSCDCDCGDCGGCDCGDCDCDCDCDWDCGGCDCGGCDCNCGGGDC